MTMEEKSFGAVPGLNECLRIPQMCSWNRTLAEVSGIFTYQLIMINMT